MKPIQSPTERLPDPFSNGELLLNGAALHQAARRLLDLASALALMILTAPLALLAMLAVRLSSRGPVLYSQVRLGRDGLPFVLHKIRTMRLDAEAGGAR